MASDAALKKKKLYTKRADLAAGTVDFLDLSTIFSMFLTEVLRGFFEQVGKFIFFPIAVAMNLTRAGLSIREAQLKKWKKRPVAKMVVEVLSGLAVTAAIVGALFFPMAFILITPIIFGTVMAFKTLFNLGASIYYLRKSMASEDQHHKVKNQKLAITHAALTVALGLATAGIVAVFLLGKIALASLAVAGGITGACVAGVSLFRSFRRKPAAQELKSVADVTHDEVRVVVEPEQPKPKSTTGILARVFRSGANDKKIEVVEKEKEKDKPLTYQDYEAAQVTVKGKIDFNTIKDDYEAPAVKEEKYVRAQML